MDADFRELDAGFEDVFDNEIYAREKFRFPLLDLPPELVIRVCELAVARTTTIDATLAPKAKNQAEILQQPAMTRTCRLLRRESLRAFYRDNDFEAFHWARHACIREWLIAIGPDNLDAMQTLTFHCKFNTEFWENKFDEIGIKTKCEEAKDQSKAIGSLHTLTVTFCNGDIHRSARLSQKLAMTVDQYVSKTAECMSGIA